MFDIDLEKIMQQSADIQEGNKENRIDAMNFAVETILDYSVKENQYCPSSKYMGLIKALLENGYYSDLYPEDFENLRASIGC